jgi:hypothetical protein
MPTFYIPVKQLVETEGEILIEADDRKDAERRAHKALEAAPLSWFPRSGVAHKVLSTEVLCSVDAEKCDDPSDLSGA